VRFQVLTAASMMFRAVFWVVWLPPSSLMMEAVRTSETSVDNHFTRQYISEDNSERHEDSPHSGRSFDRDISYIACKRSIPVLRLECTVRSFDHSSLPRLHQSDEGHTVFNQSQTPLDDTFNKTSHEFPIQ
jgi:hypothetical protein